MMLPSLYSGLVIWDLQKAVKRPVEGEEAPLPICLWARKGKGEKRVNGMDGRMSKRRHGAGECVGMEAGMEGALLSSGHGLGK